MEHGENIAPVPAPVISASASATLTLVYSAPTPGVGSRYADTGTSHESRVLSTIAARDALAASFDSGVGEMVLQAVRGALAFGGSAEQRSAAILAPLAKAAALGDTAGRVLRRLGASETEPFARALELSRDDGPLRGALGLALGGESRETTLREVMRFTATRDPLAREYARDYEITRQLAEPALLSSLSRAESARAALVQTYLEVLAEVPDLDVVRRANQQEADEVSRMARGTLKSGGVHSRRGLQAVSNLDGILRSDSRLSPTATEPYVVSAAFLVSLSYGPDALTSRLRPASGA
ncbi:MAG: triphosphoribosyl-dephospho-CoA synthase [Rubrobacter sp.]|nr:triphosphoribosyl-dephospho-CoA synthase [Rubrobacter sp.]